MHSLVDVFLPELADAAMGGARLHFLTSFRTRPPGPVRLSGTEQKSVSKEPLQPTGVTIS